MLINKPLRHLFVVTLCIMPLLLGACQSVSSTNVHTTPEVFVPTTPAKELLTKSMTAQLKKSFSYKTSARLLLNKNSDTNNQNVCDSVHDEHYVALAKLAKKNGLDLSADRYLDDKEELKQGYLACLDDEMHVWRAQEHKGSTHLAKKRYLADPVSLTVTGNYRPLLGQVSALPRADYRLGAVEMMVNQPVVVDWQAGRVYVWADNFAFANATLFDKTLGDKWREKWLSFPLNDGTLPDDFVKTFVGIYLETQKQRLNDGEFVYVPATKVLDNLPKEVFDNQAFDKARILATPILIEGRIAPQSKQWLAVVEAMNERYPVLLQADEQKNAMDSKQNADGDSVNAISTTKSLTSVHLMRWMLSSLQARASQEVGDSVLVFYGFDGNRLSWVINATPRHIKGGLEVLTMTVFDDGLIDVFERLPKIHQKPNAKNSVDGLVYLNERKPSDLTILGQIFEFDKMIETSPNTD